MPSLRPVPPRSDPAERTAALQRKEDYSMSHHYSGPDFGFPQGDARLDFTDLYAFPKPGQTGKSILIVNVHPSAGENPPGPTTTEPLDRKSTRLNSSHRCISYAVFCLKKKKNYNTHSRYCSIGTNRHVF